MAQINTYHCLCTSLLLSTTHTLSSLPTRQSSSNNNTVDNAIILPLPSSPPTIPASASTNGKAPETTLPPAGYTILLGLQADSKTTIIRREDGFEQRVAYKCGRCGLVVGYEIVSSLAMAETMDVDVDGGGGEGDPEEAYTGKILYILPGGVMSTEVMSKGGVIGSKDDSAGQKIGEGQLEILGRKGVSVFE